LVDLFEVYDDGLANFQIYLLFVCSSLTPGLKF